MSDKPIKKAAVGYKEQGKSRAANQKPVKGVKPGFAINHEQMEFERRKLLEEMSAKMSPNKKQLNMMAAVAATEEPKYFKTTNLTKAGKPAVYDGTDGLGEPREPTMRILSLGAGVQSSCLALMAQEGLTKHKPDFMIFADTGWEPKFVYEHVEYLKKAITICPIITVERGNLREDLIRAANPEPGSREEEKSFAGRVPNPPLFAARPNGGRVGMLYRQCTHDYKVIPIQKKMRELLGVKPRFRVPKDMIVEQWIGISTDEAMRMKEARMPWLTSRWPLIEMKMSRADCLQWYRDINKHPMPGKSSCIGCPYHHNDQWKNMQKNYPEDWEDACDLDDKIRHGLKNTETELFLHKSAKPLRSIDFQAPKPQQNLFGETFDEEFADECEGLCGV
jgi:hypothetical protein